MNAMCTASSWTCSRTCANSAGGVRGAGTNTFQPSRPPGADSSSKSVVGSDCMRSNHVTSPSGRGAKAPTKSQARTPASRCLSQNACGYRQHHYDTTKRPRQVLNGKCNGDRDNYEDGHDNDNNMYDGDDDDAVGYINLSTRHDKGKMWKMNRIRTTPRYIQRSKPSA